MKLSRRAHFLLSSGSRIPDLDLTPVFEQDLRVFGLYLSINKFVESGRNGEYIVLVSGEVYGLNRVRIHPAQLLLSLQKGGLNAADFNGSFSIVIVSLQDGKVDVVTDVVNSRKIFYSKSKNGDILIGTSLNYFSLGELDFDYAALGSFLANGAVYRNRTIFSSVKSIPAATTYSVNGSGETTNKYWSYQVTSSFKDIPKEDLLESFKDLLIASVEMRSNNHDSYFVSMSGGYDSAGIAGILQLLGRKNVSCFSYIHGESKPGSDAFVAKRMSEAAGFLHRVVQSYKGDSLSTIELNGLLGEGLANFCDEIDIWEELEPVVSSFSNPLLFAGDMYYLPNVEPQSLTDAVTAVGINAPSILKAYQKFSSPAIFDQIKNNWDRDYNYILNNIQNYDDFKDLKDDLYLNYRIPHTLMVWREMIQMNFISVSNPYLDRELLEFIQKLPTKMRDGKSLYIQALSEISPHLFKHKRAKENRVKPNWGLEIIQQRDRINHWLENTSSKFDEVFPVSDIALLLDFHEKKPVSMKDIVGRAGRSIKYRYPFTNKFISRFIPLPAKELDAVVMLKRVLALRAFLAN